jgi:hypothetical protein
MKILLIIDGEEKVLQAEVFDLSMGKYEGYDAVIIAASGDLQKVIHDPEEQTRVFEEMAEGIGRPSVTGITIDALDEKSLREVSEASDLLTSLRNDKHIVILPSRPGDTQKRIQRHFVLHTKFYNINSPDSLKLAVSELVELEDLKLRGNLLYLVREAMILPKGNDSFYLKEIVDVYVPKEDMSEVTLSERDVV